MNILFLTTVLPRHQRMGREVASQCFIDALRQAGHRVIIVGYMRPDDPFELGRSEILVAQRDVETQRSQKYRLLWMLLSGIMRLPYSGIKYYSRTYIQRLKMLLRHQFNLIIIDHVHLSWLQPLLPPAQKLVMIAHHLEHEIYQQRATTSSHFMRWIYWRESRLIQRLETNLARAAAQIWVLSEQDAQYFDNLGQTIGQPVEQTRGQLMVMTLPAHLSPISACAQPRSQPKAFEIGLIGNWASQPNAEGLRWFLQFVYPHLPEHLSIHVAGRGADWVNDSYPRIRYRGFVPDAQLFMAQAQVMAIPILNGSGIQIKALDAIASGSRTVATPAALRGIRELPPTVEVAEQPQQFATALLASLKRMNCSACSEKQEYGSASKLEDTDFNQSIEWHRARQTKFLDEVAAAITNL